jgi:hypothetical protein
MGEHQHETDGDETDDVQIPEQGSAERYEYGLDAQLERDYASLTQKQKNVVDAITTLPVGTSQSAIAAEANCTAGYVPYVEAQFPHIIQHRAATNQVAADGGEQSYNLRLGKTKVWKMMRLLPEDLSEDIFDQVREHAH